MNILRPIVIGTNDLIISEPSDIWRGRYAADSAKKSGDFTLVNRQICRRFIESIRQLCNKSRKSDPSSFFFHSNYISALILTSIKNVDWCRSQGGTIGRMSHASVLVSMTTERRVVAAVVTLDFMSYQLLLREKKK